MRVSTISAIGSFSAVNGGASDSLIIVPGRSTVPEADLRSDVEDVPGGAGIMLIGDILEGQQILTLGGYLEITSDGTESGYFDAIDTLYASLKSALQAMETASGNLVHSGGTLACRYYNPLTPSWEGVLKYVTFGLIVV